VGTLVELAFEGIRGVIVGTLGVLGQFFEEILGSLVEPLEAEGKQLDSSGLEKHLF